MIGGILRGHRELLTDGPYGQFEQDVNRVLGDDIRNSREEASAMWGALSNIIWIHEQYGEISYSFRAAGDLIAAIRQKGNYLDWYCNSPYEIVSDKISSALKKCGWTYKFYE